MVESADCIVIVTAHKGIDYADIADRARLVMDFRNATGKSGQTNGSVWKL
jgi:UDP-N-acetyl-D-glucosamine dehydrogenase